jgi:hypothetical protein
MMDYAISPHHRTININSITIITMAIIRTIMQHKINMTPATTQNTHLCQPTIIIIIISQQIKIIRQINSIATIKIKINTISHRAITRKHQIIRINRSKRQHKSQHWLQIHRTILIGGTCYSKIHLILRINSEIEMKVEVEFFYAFHRKNYIIVD